MITKPIVLVLGAGASRPYNFPVGRTLLCDIVQKLKLDSSNRPANQEFFNLVVNSAGCSGNEVFAFRDALWNSNQTSVDAFLEYRNDFLRIGKIAIAASLMPFEDPARMERDVDWKGKWYEELFKNMGSPLAQFKENNLSIITFNYDRSLEYFFTVSLKNTYGISEVDAIEMMREIQIVHVYGQMGSFPDERPYRNVVNPNTVNLSADSIQILHESNEDSENLRKAREILYEAEKIAFMGFGYLPVNVNRLRVGERLKHERKIYGTCFNLGEAEINRAKSSIISMGRVEMASQEHDCLSFLRNNWIL